MNILIVGNGFDLSHYLPTKYDHFMAAMAAIEKWDESKGKMGFDDLFKALYEKEDYFFSYTKAIYQTEAIKISVDQIKELKKQLKENVWYQYFLDHVKEIKTWIDFETKIEEGLISICEFISKINTSFKNYGKADFHIKELTKSNFQRDDELYYLSLLDFNLLVILKLCTNNPKYGESKTHLGAMPDVTIGFINEAWFKVEGNSSYGFSIEKYTNFLNDQLDEFIELFNFYLEDVVKKLKPKSAFQPLKSIDYDLTEIDQIYSFNYTQTYLDFYNQDTKIDFLHGRSGENQNMVLGVSELKDETLKKIKAYGFTKYHQKLMKNTNYGFLNHNEEFDNLVNPSSMREGEIIQINIWGHSLDVSDEDYIQEIFSFNQDEDQYVRVIVFYFNHTAKFSLLANLLHILSKKKVEHWMKQGWLKFEPNPNVAQLNQIQPVELAKNES